MKYEYNTKGVCTRKITFDYEDGVVKDVEFYGGCNGNLKAISKLVEGKTAEEINAILEGNVCGMKGTSCADQLAKAVMAALNAENQG